MADNKTYPQLGVRVSDEEKAVIEAEARRERLSVSSFIRSNIMKMIDRRRSERGERADNPCAEAA